MTPKTKSNRRAVIGVDFGATNLKALVIDEQGKVHARFVVPSQVDQGPRRTVKRIADLIKTAETKAKSAGLSITDVGIGVCAPVDQRRGTIPESPVLPGWRNVPMKKTLQTVTDLPIHLDNDANLAILGEWWQGVAKNGRVVAGLTLGTGIGGGLMIDGRVYRGAFGFGAEFGHISLAASPPCPCGGHGCLGRLASITDTLECYRVLAGRKAAVVSNIDELGRLAKHGDIFAKEAIRISSEYLAKAILILINCFNPDTFVLAGGMASLGATLFRPIQKFIKASTFPFVAASTRIEMAKLGIYSGCFGAAKLALSEAADRSEAVWQKRMTAD